MPVTPKKPDYVATYEWATGRVAVRGCPNHGKRWPCVGATGGAHHENCWDRWCGDSPGWLAELPKLESAQWRKDVMDGLARSKDFCQVTIGYDKDEDGEHFTVEPEWHPDGCDAIHTSTGGNGTTPNSALCAAVLAAILAAAEDALEPTRGRPT